MTCLSISDNLRRVCCTFGCQDLGMMSTAMSLDDIFSGERGIAVPAREGALITIWDRIGSSYSGETE